MSKQSIIPFGPQHPVLPEPIHIDLVLEDEKVVEAVPSIGFVHRGLEMLAEKRDFNDYQYVVERTCVRLVTGSATVKRLKQYSMPKCLKEQSFCVHFGLK